MPGLDFFVLWCCCTIY